MRKLKVLFIIFLLFFLYTYISALSYASAVSRNISDSVFRLHVIANSDSNEDQILKLKIRDNLINYMNSISKNTLNKQEAINIAKNNQEEFYKIAKNTILENGYNYDVKIEIGNFFFPTKKYGDISLPAGFYDALKVEIGNADGQNWWCVMFPPLCFVDVTSGIVPDESKDTLKNNLNDEEYALISQTNTSRINFKFKLIELLNRSQNSLF